MSEEKPSEKKLPTEQLNPTTATSNEKIQAALLSQQPDIRDLQIDELTKNLVKERDARREDLFIFIVVIVLLLDVVFFSLMPNFAGPIALVVLELLILIPLALRMGMEEVAQLFDRALGRIADGLGGKKDK